MSYTKRRLEDLLSKAEEEFCDFLRELPHPNLNMRSWDGSEWSHVAKSFSFVFILRNTGDFTDWDDWILGMFRDLSLIHI